MAGFTTVRAEFFDEVVRSFEFLIGEFGLVGPELETFVLPTVTYTRHGVSYQIVLNTEDKVVSTDVDVDLDQKRLVADLADIVLASGLGARNHVARSAHTLHGLRHALASQAKYVRLLQPFMTSETVIELMRAANAREWTIR